MAAIALNQNNTPILQAITIPKINNFLSNKTVCSGKFPLIRALHLHFNVKPEILAKWKVTNETGCVPWKLTSFVYLRAIAEESEAASKQVLAKAEQIRKFQEENKYLGQLVSHADEIFCKP